MRTIIDRVLERVADDDADDDADAEDVGELEIAEYVVFLLAMDTYVRYIEEVMGENYVDELVKSGLKLARLADRKYKDGMHEFLGKNVPTDNHRRLLDRAFRFPPNATGYARRTYYLRTALSRGGAPTMRSVFKTNKALRSVREAITASMMDDADAALDKFAVLPLKNARMRKWIDDAAENAGSGTFQDPVSLGSDQGSDEVEQLKTSRVQQQGSTATADDNQDTSANTGQTLVKVQQQAAEAAQKSMQVSGEDDDPPAKSEVVGIATAAAVAAVTDPDNPSNVPDPLRKLDAEQRAAAITDGKVLVAAGAGAGKSTTVVSRVEYLIKDRRVSPSRMLVTSFNTKAAAELKQKIGTATSGDVLNQMSVGTMHSLFRKFIGEYGTAQERSAMGLGKTKGFVQGGMPVARAVQRIWADCYPADTPQERKVPKLKNVMMAKSKWSGNNVTPEQAKNEASTQEEVDMADWYEMYEGLKGSIPGWRPPCRKSKAYEAFMGRWRQDGQRLGDFDDMLGIFDGILKREPAVRRTLQDMFDHIIVDEAQDLSGVQFSIISQMSEHISDGSDGKSLWICGDDKQCVAATTPISTPTGTTLAGELREGDEVLAYRNGVVTAQRVRHVALSKWEYGFKITTESGATLTLSPNHKIWASDPMLKQGEHLVYLMFRRDLGFRVGTTNKGSCEDDSRLLYGQRPQAERAERLWVLDICSTKEEAATLESVYSLRYQIPTIVYHSSWNRQFPEAKIAALFQEFGENGVRLLENKGLSAEYPNWMCRNSRLLASRTIQLIAHGPKGTQVSLEWDGDEGLDDRVGVAFKSLQEGRRRVRKWFTNYRDALDFAEKLNRRTGFNLSHRLSVPDCTPLRKVTGAALFVGMSVAVQDDETGIRLEPITAIEEVPGTFLDLDVDDASNFFGGGILSSNSIYGFRGARPDLFTELNTEEGWTTKMIRTNYRCPPEVVDAANRLINHNEDQIPMEANPAPGKTRGVASVRVETALDEAEASLGVVEEIKAGIEAYGDVTDHAILTRTNKEQHSFETACIIRGVPYARKGASSFLGSPETKAFLSYIQLVTGSDASKMQAGLAEVLNKPNRFFVSPDAAAKAVEDALYKYALNAQEDVKTINPVRALESPVFVENLASSLARTRSGFKYNKTVQKLHELADDLRNMRASVEDPEYTTKDLFDEILGLSGTTTVTNSITGKTDYVEQTFRDSLKADLRDSSDEESTTDEDEDEDEAAGLGNISFLYELVKPDPTDPEDRVTDPNTPLGFQNKMERYAKKARELRIDISKWEKEQAALPPEQRKAPPGVYLGTVHCSPADEPVFTTEGWVTIGDLDPTKHRLTSYAPNCNQLFWGDAKSGHDGPDGYGFVKSSMPYKGPLLTLETPQSSTRLTPDHRIRVKWSETFFNKYVVYLMRRGDWWRIGVSKSGNRPYGGGDFKQHVSAEKADACWLLGVYETRTEAVLEETRVQGYYGITGATFEAGNQRRVTSAQLHALHESIKGPVQERVDRLLGDYGLAKRNPLYEGGVEQATDMRSAFTIQARNCLSGYMLLPVAPQSFLDRTGSRDTWTKPEWHKVAVTVEPFEGDVYSLAVPPHHFYVSGGAIVHNSVKGAQWKNCYVSMPKGKFPFEPPVKPGALPKPPEVAEAEMASERRLGYVALTRAAGNLTIVCPSSVGGKAAGISPFVDEAGLNVGENVPKPGADTSDDDDSAGMKTASSFDYDGVLPDDWETPEEYDRRPQ